MGALIILSLFASLSEEVDVFMADYYYNGYTSQFQKALYLEGDQPITFRIYPGQNYEGVVCGVGGSTIFNLQLELIGSEWNIRDEYPDDLPVIEFSTEEGSLDYIVTVSAADFLYGSTADSAYVFLAMRPIELEIEDDIYDSVPEEPDSAIIGE